MPYSFGYDVKDDYYYTDFGHQESGDGKGNVDGSYRVLLPDGRTQIVTYKVDGYSGYMADVKYEGEAKHHEYKEHKGYGEEKHQEYKPMYKHEHKEHKGYGEEKHHEYKPMYKHEHKEHKGYGEEKHHEYKPMYKHEHKEH